MHSIHSDDLFVEKTMFNNFTTELANLLHALNYDNNRKFFKTVLIFPILAWKVLQINLPNK